MRLLLLPMMKSKIIVLFFLVFTSLYSFSQTNQGITVERADHLCEKGLDIDSCDYIPLYNSFFNWLGTPYKYAGNTKKGVDCSSFVKNVLKEAFNLEVKGSSRTIYTKCKAITQKDELKEGDLVFFKINKRTISHIGLYLKNGYFVHASVSRGVMINNLSENYYKKYFFQGGRIFNT